MSAWIVFPRHIDYIVEGSQHYGGLSRVRFRGLPIEEYPPDMLGEILMGENVKSVEFRYERDTFEQLPGPIDKTRVRPYWYEPSGLDLRPEAVVAAIGCYDYQSCECAEWRDDGWHYTWTESDVRMMLEQVIAGCERELGPVLCRPMRSNYGGETPSYKQTEYYDALPWGIDPSTQLPDRPQSWEFMAQREVLA